MVGAGRRGRPPIYLFILFIYMSNWAEKERFGLPEYLLRTCPSSLREGRRLKTKFRLGCHDLRSSSCRMQRVRNAQCPCCESRESETIQHALFECKAFEEEREVFLSRLYSVCPLARQLTDDYRCRLVMGDNLPRDIENPFYRRTEDTQWSTSQRLALFAPRPQASQETPQLSH